MFLLPTRQPTMKSIMKKPMLLLPEQEKAYQVMMEGKSVFITGAAGTGKCLGRDTPVKMYDGEIKMIQDIKVGELVMGDDWTPRTVLNTTQGVDEMYTVHPERTSNCEGNCDDNYTVNSAHVLTLQSVKKVVPHPFIENVWGVKWGGLDGTINESFRCSSEEEAEALAKELPILVDIPISTVMEGLAGGVDEWSTYFETAYAFHRGMSRDEMYYASGLYRCRMLINPIGLGDYWGFQLDGNHRFQLGSGIITHNSTIVSKFYTDCCYKKTIAITSTTGTSALLIGGTTIHSYLGIGIGKGTLDAMVMNIMGKKYYRNRWNKLDTLIIDEISMLSPTLFDKLDKIGRVIRRTPDKPWGGIQLVLTGDMLQLPVVNCPDFCFDAESWDESVPTQIYLTKIVRQDGEKFIKCLNDIRIGSITPETKQLLESCVNKKFTKNGIKPTQLFPTNRQVKKVNDMELDRLAEKYPNLSFRQYDMDIQFYPDVKNKAFIREKFLKNCQLLESLQLCIGAQVMLLINLDLDEGLANGSRGVIVDFVGDMPKVKFMNGTVRIIEQHAWDHEVQDKPLLKAVQIPIKPAWGISIHKTQGMTLDCVKIDMGNIFEYGQAYVGLSRVKSFEGLCITSLDWDRIKAHPRALEYYKSLVKESPDKESPDKELDEKSK